MVILNVILESIGAVGCTVECLLRLAADQTHLNCIPHPLVLVGAKAGECVDDNTEDNVQHGD